MSHPVEPKVLLLEYPKSIAVSYLSARLCYSKGEISLNELPTEQMMEKFLQEKVTATGHLSILEHLNFSFLITGMSRITSQQLTRHRHISPSQRSQRYVNEQDFSYVIPPSIKQCPAAYKRFIAAMDTLQQEYKEIQEDLQQFYQQGGEEVNQDARFILPNAIETRLTFSVNGRGLVEMSKKRLCRRAQWELRGIFHQIHELVSGVCPLVSSLMSPPCVGGSCPEGEKSCKYRKETHNA
jgi:thymidylate synthase (FAD)